MLGLELVVIVGVALVLCGALAQKLPIAPAISLLAVGVLIGFVPGLREMQLPPRWSCWCSSRLSSTGRA